ncbi:hypothetical protein D0859_08449 [Hortaea werneckii]|uniref:Uncharacterized protein n=1 Tax=Hortaea werneckii TaxID=91943 RepID=A0A3M7IQ73_HORWE|nr:hypothetical protein D0859_08449 [Hortaea werneckii]
MAEPGAHLKRNVQECALEGEGEDEEESEGGKTKLGNRFVHEPYGPDASPARRGSVVKFADDPVSARHRPRDSLAGLEDVSSGDETSTPSSGETSPHGARSGARSPEEVGKECDF